MSFDPNQNQPPMGHVPPKKSGALKWILGGIGCFGLITVLCLGGVGYMSYRAYQDLTGNSAYLEARATIESSAEIGEAVGNPVTVGEPTGPPQPIQNGERVTIVYDVPFSGPKGSGMAEIKVEGQLMTDDWNLQSLSAEVDGKEIPLGGGGLDVNIEGE